MLSWRYTKKVPLITISVRELNGYIIPKANFILVQRDINFIKGIIGRGL